MAKTEVLVLLGRPDCGLCEEMEAGVRAHPDFARVELQHADVDARPEWQRRYGLRVPVLLDRWNEVVCEARFDADAFSDWCHDVMRRRV